MRKLIIGLLLFGAAALASNSSTRNITGDLWKSADLSKTWTPPTAPDTLLGLTATQTPTNKSLSGSSNTFTNIPANTALTGQVPIANGGTGQSTKAAAFDALSPMSASGDIIYGGTSGTGTRLAKGSDGNYLNLSSGLPVWGAVVAPAGTLTGTTLNSTVVTSSLTTVGTIATGTWSATTIALNKGGTGQTTAANAINALLPTQTSNSGKYLTTNGSVASWGSISGAGTTTGIIFVTSNGSGGSCTLTSTTDVRITASGVIGGLCTLTFNSVYAQTPYCVLTGTDTPGGIVANFAVGGEPTTTGFTAQAFSSNTGVLQVATVTALCFGT